MIKINLLAEGKRPTAVRKARAGRPFLERDDVAQWMLLGGLLVPVLIGGGLWLKFDRELEVKKQEVVEAREEVEKLKAVLEEVEQFKAKKAELEHKIAVINELKANQRGPVRVMDAISRALPELLWLDKMEVRPSTITLSGQAFNINAVANFIENLDRVPEFREPVLRDSSQQGRVYKFVITFTYSYAPAAPPAQATEGVSRAPAAG